jgi:hypothetical protein
VVVIALALLVKSCDSSATTSALKNYNASVYHLIAKSTSNAQNVLGPHVLESGNLTGIDTQLAKAEQNALDDVRTAESLHVPSQMAPAQTSLLTVLNLRQRGLKLIATYAKQAASKNSSKDAVYEISLGTAQLFTSDVIYKTSVTEDIAKALNADNIPIGVGSQGQQINGGQVIKDLGWLNQTWIADKIHAHQTTAAANANNDQPGLHGHALDSVSVDAITLQPGVTNTVPASKARLWALGVTNGGNFDEFQVGCSLKIVSQSDAGTGVIAETYPGQTASCDVTLPSTPQTGPYQVIATIDKVPGETNLKNNVLTYDVTFT